MLLFTRCGRQLLAVAALFFGVVGGPAWAQHGPPAFTDPAVLDPTYAARKARLAQPAPPNPAGAAQRGVQPPGTPLPACFEPLDKTTYTAVPRNDDGSLGPINLGFQFYLFGTPHSRVFINTNGNITFDAPLEAFTATGFPINTPMVAPFWADVDTREPSTGTRGAVWYRLYNDRLVVTWDSVGYYDRQVRLKNNFQLTIYANAGGALVQDVVFAYGDMQWTTGDASNGAGGFGGIPANAGVNEGNGTGRFIQIGRFNLDGTSHPDNTSNSGIDYLDYQCFGFRVFDSGNQPPAVSGLPVSGAITVNQGQTVTLTPQFFGPEPGQVVTVTPSTDGLCNTTAVVGPGSNPVVNFAITGAPCNVGTHVVRFFAQDNGVPVASSTFTLTIVVNPPVSAATWDGDVSTDYLNARNWVGDVQPLPTDNVLIPSTAPRFPVLTGTAAAGTFAVQPGASMTVAAASTLALAGDLNTGGSFGGPGTLDLRGTVRQNIGGATGIDVGELRVGLGGALQTGAVAVRQVLDLTGSLTTGGFAFTLVSDAAASGMVVNRGTGRVVGNATVQRYIDPSRNPGAGYRHFAAPVEGATVAALNRPGFAPVVVNSGYNTVGNTVTPFPTVFGYDQSRVTTSGGAGSLDFDRGFFSPGSTADPLADAKGYTANVEATTIANINPPPISFTGALHNGIFNPGALPRGIQTESGWHLLGNPYPAPLDWDAAFAGATGLDNAVYVFKSSGRYAGSYDAYVNGVGPARYIGVAQGFFVRTSAPGGTGQLALTNAARVTTYRNPAFSRSTPTLADARPQLRLDLVSNGQADAAYVYFENGATAGFDRQYDAYKLPGGRPLYLATGAGSPPFAINGLPALTAAGAAVPLLAYLPQAGSFSLTLGEAQNFGTATLLLEDRQTGRWHDLRQQPTWTFQAARPDEAAARFVLHVNQARPLATAAALPPEAVSVWPNPATGAVHLSVAALPATPAALELTLLNVLGQVVLRQTAAVQAGRAAATLDVRALAPGLYVLRGATATHTFARSVVVQ